MPDIHVVNNRATNFAKSRLQRSDVAQIIGLGTVRSSIPTDQYSGKPFEPPIKAQAQKGASNVARIHFRILQIEKRPNRPGLLDKLRNSPELGAGEPGDCI